jgi:Ca-activated chloride channel family protein
MQARRVWHCPPQPAIKRNKFLSVLGVGDDNLNDSMMQKLADRGNGNYAYLDSIEEARKVLVQQINGTLVTIAKDVKVQVEFNPARVVSYRLIGCEKRILQKDDFKDDKIDAGEIGAGRTVTALYEVVPVGGQPDPAASVPSVDALKYQRGPASLGGSDSPEWLTVKLRYKKPNGDTSKLIERPFVDSGAEFASAAPDLKFAAAVAEFGDDFARLGVQGKRNVRRSAGVGGARGGRGCERLSRGFVELVRRAQALKARM